MSNNSVSLHRVIKAPPEKIFRAFTEASALAAWLPPYGFLCTVHEIQPETGEFIRCHFKTLQRVTGILLVGNILR